MARIGELENRIHDADALINQTRSRLKEYLREI